MNYSQKADFFKALSNKTRLEILDKLEADGCNVNKMVLELKIPQSTLSQHLAVLKNAGIVETKKEGYNTCYKIKDNRIKKILKLL